MTTKKLNDTLKKAKYELPVTIFRILISKFEVKILPIKKEIQPNWESFFIKPSL